MTRISWALLCPALVVAGGTLASTAVIVHAGDTAGWLAVGGLLLLALAVVVADALRAGLQGRPVRPSTGASLLGAAFVLAGAILMPLPARTLASLVPIFAVSAWMTLFSTRRRGGHSACGAP